MEHPIYTIAPEAMADVRETLKKEWYMLRREQYLRRLEDDWKAPESQHYPRMVTVEKITQDVDEEDEEGNHNQDFVPTLVKMNSLAKGEPEFCNKATVFYWMESAKLNNSDTAGFAILGSIWNAWCDALGRQPSFQLEDFFAVPVGISERYPGSPNINPRALNVKTIPEILRVHECIWSQVQCASKKRDKWWSGKDPRYFRLHPLCDAMIVVFDEYKWIRESFRKQADGFRHYDNVAQHQNILLVRTGNEKGLSKPINFSSLKDKVLPLARTEDMGSIDVIRVPLTIGVRFVAELLLREEAAFPKSDLRGSKISTKSDHPFVKAEKEAMAEGEQTLARAWEDGKIWKSSTASEMKEAMMLHPKLDDPEYWNPPPYFSSSFTPTWI